MLACSRVEPLPACLPVPSDNNPLCPLEECVGACSLETRLACCLRAHGAPPVDEAGAMCLALAHGMPPGKQECLVWLEGPHWVVETITEDECDAPHHLGGWQYKIQISDGALLGVDPVTYSTIGECMAP